MTHHRKPLLPALLTQVTGSYKDGALGAHRHRLAMTMLGSTVAAGAILGSALTTGEPVALAASTQHLAQPLQPVRKVTPTAPAETAAASSLAVAVVPTATATVTTDIQSRAKALVVKAPPKAPVKAPAAQPEHTRAPAPPANNPYAGESAYKVAEGIVPGSQFGCFDWIVTRESGWNVTATNPSSGAYGLGQALPGDKMASAGPDWQTDPATQIRWTLGYMNERYGSPCAAQSFWEDHGWY